MKANNKHLKKASIDDLSSILELDIAVGSEYFSSLLPPSALAVIFNYDRVAQKIKYAISSKSQQSLFIYKENNNIIGYAICGAKHSFESNNKIIKAKTMIGMISPIRVISSHRGKGVGKILIEASFSYLAQLGMTHIISRTLANNIASHEFYNALGGTQKGHCLTQVGAERIKTVIYEWTQPFKT